MLRNLCERAAAPALLSLGFFIIFASGARELLLRDPDLYWHLVVGQKILATGTFPWTDEYSHTFFGQPWIAKEWLAQVILAKTYGLGGWYAIVALMACCVAATFTLLFAFLAERMRPVPALIATLFAYALCATHFVARPHLLALPLLVLWTGTIARAVDANRVPSVFWILVIGVWANLHGGFTLGLFLAAGLAAEAVLAAPAADRIRVAGRWLLFLAAAGAVTLVTPYGPGALSMTYRFLAGNESLKYLSEWFPLNFGSDRLVSYLLMSALFLAIWNGVRLPLIRCMLTIGMVYLMFRHFRFVAIAAVVLPILILAPLTRQFAQLRAAQASGWLGVPLLGARPVSVFAAVILLGVVAVGSVYLPERSPLRLITPAGAVDYLQRSGATGKVYNEYGFGGYLIFRGIPTFVDGRADQLFGGGFLDTLFSSLEGPKEEFLKLLDRYHISIAIVRPNSPETMRLDDAPGWRRAYADDVSVLYQRVSGSAVPAVPGGGRAGSPGGT